MAVQGNTPATKAAEAVSTSGSYFLKSLVQDVELSEKDTLEVRITCVELWGRYTQIKPFGRLEAMLFFD